MTFAGVKTHRHVCIKNPFFTNFQRTIKIYKTKKSRISTQTKTHFITTTDVSTPPEVSVSAQCRL